MQITKILKATKILLALLTQLQLLIPQIRGVVNVLRAGRKNKVRIGLVGAECTGKSTIARVLASKYNLRLVPEVAMEYQTDEREALSSRISECQRTVEEIDYQESPRGIVAECATVLGSYYHRFYTGELKKPETSQYTLLLYSPIEGVQLVQNGHRNNNQLQREEIDAFIKDDLTQYNCKVVRLSGSLDQRIAQACKATEEALK